MTTATVTCACGATGEREAATGPLADRLNAFGWICPECEQREGEELREHRRRSVRDKRDRTSTIPKGLRRNLANLAWDAENSEALRQAQEWRDGHLKGLLFTGEFGVGKTSIAAAAAWERSLTRPVTWASVPKVVQDMTRAFGDEERAVAVDALTGRGGLVLDDLDKVKASEWSCAQLLAAIDSRIADDRPLLVTMNVSLGQLAEKLGPEYGGAIASRLAGYCEVVRVSGSDRRLARRAG